MLSYSTLNNTFAGCHAEIKGAFDTKNVTEMKNTFSRYKGVDTLDLTWMNVSNVMEMQGVFYSCFCDYIDLRGWDVRNVKTTAEMFRKCSSNIRGLDKLNFMSVEVATKMFCDVKWHRRIKLKGMSWANITDADDMFALAHISMIDLTDFSVINKYNESRNARSAGMRTAVSMFSGFSGIVAIDADNCAREFRLLVVKSAENLGNMKVRRVHKE